MFVLQVLARVPGIVTIKILNRPRYHRLVHPSSILLRPYLSGRCMHFLIRSNHGLPPPRKPERSSRMDPIRIKLRQLVVKSSRGCRCRGYAVEIADVLLGLFNDLGAVVIPISFASSDHSAWVE